jgi:hypothetical protein
MEHDKFCHRELRRFYVGLTSHREQQHMRRLVELAFRPSRAGDFMVQTGQVSNR